MGFFRIRLVVKIMNRLTCLAILTIITAVSLKPCEGVEGFVEPFDGLGPFSSVQGNHHGFHNEGWRIVSNGDFVEDGFLVDIDSPPLRGEVSLFRQSNLDVGNFIERVDIDDVFLKPFFAEHPDTSNRLGIVHVFDLSEPDNSIWMFLTQVDGNPDDWALAYRVPGKIDGLSVPVGVDIRLEVHFDQVNSSVSFLYDPDYKDADAGILLGPFEYLGSVSPSHIVELEMSAAGVTAARGLIKHWSFLPSFEGMGDFSDNGVLDAADVDLLAAEIRSDEPNVEFDLNFDEIVDELDRIVWVHDVSRTYFGDSNLDGEFNSSDFVTVFKAGEYEDDIEMNSGWAEGDWNGDGDFNSRDFVFAFQDGGYEQGPRVAAVVPEPSSAFFALLGVAVLFSRTRSS